MKINWQEDEDELFNHYRQEKEAYKRIRLQAFWQLRQGKSLEQVSQLVGISYRTLQRWVAWYRPRAYPRYYVAPQDTTLQDEFHF